MKPSECAVLEAKIEADLEKFVNDPNYSKEVIKGHGFSELYLKTDIYQVRKMKINMLD